MFGKVVSTMPKVKVEDIQIYYEVRGEGFPLVMIMGISGNVDWWNPRMVQELSKDFKVVMFDSRGAGRTDLSNREYTIKLFADDTAGLMDALGISAAHVFGVSMGGAIAQELVLNHPERVKKLVLCSASCGGTKSVPASAEVLGRFGASRSGLSPEEICRRGIPLIFSEDFIEKNPDFVEFFVQRVLIAPISDESFMRRLDAVRKFDTYDRLSQIRVPTLILHGKGDILVPFENCSILAEAIPNAKLVCFEKSAHGLIYEEMNKMIRVTSDFLAGP